MRFTISNDKLRNIRNQLIALLCVFFQTVYNTKFFVIWKVRKCYWLNLTPGLEVLKGIFERTVHMSSSKTTLLEKVVTPCFC